MKAIIIYSGKGGVGKTTTTANIARLLAKQGNKVFICRYKYPVNEHRI